MPKEVLHNKKNKKDLLLDLKNEEFQRVTLSFYKYVSLDNLEFLRDELYKQWNTLQVLGRAYIAYEGINAQVSIPEQNIKKFKKIISSMNNFNQVIFKPALNSEVSFLKLTIKIKKEIVAYKIHKSEYDMNNIGNHLNYKEFNDAIENGAIVIDMRNYYEGEIGKFENAIIPDIDRSEELLPEIKKILTNHKNDKILMYCTGGIRCEKASSYLIKNGFKDVNQLKGGIIQYANDIKKNKEQSKFIGKNFVFDNRMGERVTEDIISNCHLCNSRSDHHINCKNEHCHILLIQCDKCLKQYNGCCSNQCKEFVKLPKEEQKIIFKTGEIKFNAQKSSKIKPKLSQLT